MNRGVEIDTGVADLLDRSIIITRQVEMGVAMRMACLDVLTRAGRGVKGWAGGRTARETNCAPLFIGNGKLVLPGRVEQGALTLHRGSKFLQSAISHRRTVTKRLTREGHLIAPGLIDYGVFAVDKPAFHFGGITRAALMPDQSPPLDYPARVNFIAKSGKPDMWVHPLAAATRGLGGKELAEIGLMRDAGARGIASGRDWIVDSGTMLRLLQYAAMLDMVVVTHAEDTGLTAGAVATAGEMATRLGLSSAPAEAEALAIAREPCPVPAFRRAAAYPPKSLRDVGSTL